MRDGASGNLSHTTLWHRGALPAGFLSVPNPKDYKLEGKGYTPLSVLSMQSWALSLSLLRQEDLPAGSFLQIDKTLFYFTPVAMFNL